MELGKKVRELRLARKLTLEDMAGESGLSLSYLSYLERGKRQINFKSLAKIASVLNVPVPVLVFLSASDDELEGDLKELVSTLNKYVITIHD